MVKKRDGSRRLVGACGKGDGGEGRDSGVGRGGDRGGGGGSESSRGPSWALFSVATSELR